MDRPLQVMAACRARDLPILELMAQRLADNVPLRELHVVVPDSDCPQIQSRLGTGVRVISENEFIPGMQMKALRTLTVPRFPQAAGWYFQQLLKLQFAFESPEDDYYLIWDADTVPLRPLRFFDAQGRMLLTRATEYHAPYFETYRRLFGEDARREFSFIAQHILVQKSVVREMLEKIEQKIPGTGNWAWKIMRSLPVSGDNLFSEYETYGHYVKSHYPDRITFVDRPWLREGTQRIGGGVPTADDLEQLAREFDFVAFERVATGWRRMARSLLRRVRNARR
ncbi:MAG: hypothetical protein IH623_27050 [Verrucomicrobia bacterium]|nr:hypothetical protein [Verrucomicrobiota bacterium]